MVLTEGANHGAHSGGCEFLVVGAAGGRVDEAAGDAVNEQRVGDVEVEDAVDGRPTACQHLVELLRLCHVAREAVQDESCTSLSVRRGNFRHSLGLHWSEGVVRGHGG